MNQECGKSDGDQEQDKQQYTQDVVAPPFSGIRRNGSMFGIGSHRRPALSASQIRTTYGAEKSILAVSRTAFNALDASFRCHGFVPISLAALSYAVTSPRDCASL